MSRRLMHFMLIWHSWRASWWESLEAQAERMRDYHANQRETLSHELFPRPHIDDLDLALAEMRAIQKKRGP